MRRLTQPKLIQWRLGVCLWHALCESPVLKAITHTKYKGITQQTITPGIEYTNQVHNHSSSQLDATHVVCRRTAMPCKQPMRVFYASENRYI
ncbi:MAG: hypothetical protein ACREPR_17375 [Brasilonema sp.]